tara:strand:- start:278 stop:454 length:177 start_codon:yes stop_codon:yes gene_type:complete
MVSFNEVRRVEEQFKKLVFAESPPELKINIICEGMERPETSPWALTIYIESKNERLTL